MDRERRYVIRDLLFCFLLRGDGVMALLDKVVDEEVVGWIFEKLVDLLPYGQRDHNGHYDECMIAFLTHGYRHAACGYDGLLSFAG